MPRSRSWLPFALLLLSIAPRAQNLTPIAIGNATTTVSSQASWRRPVAVLPTGIVWTLVRAVDPNDASLYLTASLDGGQTWTGRFDLPTLADGAGSIATGRECGRLLVAWYANDTGGFANAYFQEFDTLTGAFLGQPLQLTNATSANDQYYAQDVGTTESGAVCVAITTHRSPPSTTWYGGWAAGLFVRPAGAVTFDPVRQVNTDLYGQMVDMQIVGEVAHMAFRTNTGGYGIRYRAYDVAAGAFTTATDVQVEAGTSNVSQIAADASGGLYVLYVKGGTTAGSGELRLAYAAPGNPTTWTAQTVTPDTDLLRGNVAYYHCSLATTGTDQVWVVYSRVTGEQLQNLYLRPYVGGQPLTNELPIATTTDAGRFTLVGGVRTPGTSIAPSAVVESRAAIHVGNRVDFLALGPLSRGVRYGIGCRGTLPTTPLLHTVDWPGITPTLTVGISDAPANQPAALLLSPSCLAQPLDLSFVGMTGCRLELVNPDAAGLPIGANGTARFSLTPPTPVPYHGVAFQLQAIVVALGANPLGAVTTNAQTIVFE